MSNIAKQFEDVISAISQNLIKHGVHKELWDQSLSNFSKQPEPRQSALLKRSTLQLEQMELLEPGLSQQDYINTLCLFHRLKPIDKNILQKLSDDMLWEILDFDFNQIYRSKLIYKLSNYCISQMEEHTPFELYDRPKRVLEQMMECVAEMKGQNKIVDMTHIRPYILKELKSDAKDMFQIHHQFVCPLVDIETGEAKAFVAAFKCLKLANASLHSNILLMS